MADRPTTAGGYDATEAISAVQKAIRRGEVENAVYWATELERSGFGAWVWKRLRVIVSEDVGPAWVEGPAVIDALYRTYGDLRRNRNPRQNPHRMPFVHAVVLLASADKSRLVDWVRMVAYRGGLEQREVPDVALDRHTRRGRQRGAGWDEFFDVGTILSPHADGEFGATQFTPSHVWDLTYRQGPKKVVVEYAEETWD